jgi:hypothetical protein
MSTRIPREKVLFCQVMEIADLEQRRQFLDQACGADKAWREQVERLLALSPSAGNFFEQCAPALEPAAAEADPARCLWQRNRLWSSNLTKAGASQILAPGQFFLGDAGATPPFSQNRPIPCFLLPRCFKRYANEWN